MQIIIHQFLSPPYRPSTMVTWQTLDDEMVHMHAESKKKHKICCGMQQKKTVLGTTSGYSLCYHDLLNSVVSGGTTILNLMMRKQAKHNPKPARLWPRIRETIHTPKKTTERGAIKRNGTGSQSEGYIPGQTHKNIFFLHIHIQYYEICAQANTTNITNLGKCVINLW